MKLIRGYVVFYFISPLFVDKYSKQIYNVFTERRGVMDYGKMTLDEIKNGYKYEKEQDAYVCNHCGQVFHAGQIFQIDGDFFMAESAVIKHIRQIHSGNLTQLLHSESKYNTLTQNQRDLLAMFHSKISDKDMAKKLNVTEATIRRQRFTFREKAKQAKFYLAMYELVFEDGPATAEQIIPIHNNAIFVDDRYLITEDEKQNIINTFFSTTHPLVLKSFSPKEKKKVVILGKIAEQFEYGKKYSEQEVNEILRPIYEDYMTIRRYLIMYGFMERTKDGRQYWLTN